jgi:outer membrane immunogenic protein
MFKMIVKHLKRLIFPVFLTFSVVSSSTPCWSLEGPYVGLSVGPETALFKQNSTVSQPGNFAVVEKTNLGGRGFIGSIFAGYSFNLCAMNPNFNNLYFAVEGNIAASTVQHKDYNLELQNNNFNNANYSLRDAYSLSLLPGFFLTDCTLFYGRVAYGARRFVLSTTEITIPNVNTYIPFARYGLGITQFFCDNFSVRLEYSWATYKKSNLLGFDVPAAVGKYTSVAPKTNALEIGLSYYF